MAYENQISYIKIVADRKYDGHYVVMNIGGIHKGAFGMPENNFLYQVDLLKPFDTMDSLLNDMLQNETHFTNE